MTDLHPLPAATTSSRRAALAASRHLHAIVDEVPAAYTVVESDIPVLLATYEAEDVVRRPANLGGLWFGLCVVVSTIVLVAYDALVGFG